jgi:hypothetical protein
MKVIGEGRDADCVERKSTFVSDGSQASPVRRSDKGSMKVKTLRWLEVVA